MTVCSSCIVAQLSPLRSHNSHDARYCELRTHCGAPLPRLVLTARAFVCQGDNVLRLFRRVRTQRGIHLSGSSQVQHPPSFRYRWVHYSRRQCSSAVGVFRHVKEAGLKEEIHAKVIAKGKPVEHWEKKGASLLTTNNVRKYREVRGMVNRLLNTLDRLDAKVVFYGQEKPRGTNDETAENETSRYDHAMKQLIQRVNRSLPDGENYLLLMDKQGPKERMEIFASSAAFMFSQRSRPVT